MCRYRAARAAKNTIRDGGSTVLLSAYAVHTVDRVYIVDNAYTVFTIETALH